VARYPSINGLSGSTSYLIRKLCITSWVVIDHDSESAEPQLYKLRTFAPLPL
jgi:hypothetical protein